MQRIAFVALLALALAPCLAAADDSAPADSAATVDSLAPHTCKKPVIGVKMRQADDDSALEAKAERYKDCMNAYIAAQNDLATKHRAAGNNAVAEYNAFVNEMNARQQQ